MQSSARCRVGSQLICMTMYEAEDAECWETVFDAARPKKAIGPLRYFPLLTPAGDCIKILPMDATLVKFSSVNDVNCDWDMQGLLCKYNPETQITHIPNVHKKLTYPMCKTRFSSSRWA